MQFSLKSILLSTTHKSHTVVKQSFSFLSTRHTVRSEKYVEKWPHTRGTCHPDTTAHILYDTYEQCDLVDMMLADVSNKDVGGGAFDLSVFFTL